MTDSKPPRRAFVGYLAAIVLALIVLYSIGRFAGPPAQTRPTSAAEVATAPAARTPAWPASYRGFLRALEVGADCAQLFELRNAARRTATAAEQTDMNERLRGVGCYSSGSRRQKVP